MQMQEIDREQVNKMNRALKNARFELANDGKKIRDPVAGNTSRFFVVRPIREEVLNWTELVRSRLFWMRLVASQRDSGSQDAGAGNTESNKKY